MYIVRLLFVFMEFIHSRFLWLNYFEFLRMFSKFHLSFIINFKFEILWCKACYKKSHSSSCTIVESFLGLYSSLTASWASLTAFSYEFPANNEKSHMRSCAPLKALKKSLQNALLSFGTYLLYVVSYTWLLKNFRSKSARSKPK